MERAFAELIRAVHDDYDLDVVASELAEDLRPLVREWLHVRGPTRPAPLRFILFLVLAGLRLRLRHASHDLVHTMGALVLTRADVSTVQYCHAGYRRATGALAPPGAPLPRRLNTTIARLLAIACERWCYRPGRLRILAPVSHGVARELERDFPGIPVAVTPNGVDVARFRPDEGAGRALRLAEAIPDDELGVLFVGGNWDRKGLAVAIEAVGMAVRRGAPMTLWVVGEGERRRFEVLARRHGVAEHVRFFGRRDDTERFYQSADVFVFPTLYEAFPLVALEAAAAGLPIVATRVNGVEELLEGGLGGVLVEPHADSVAAALVRLAASPAERRRLGAEAHRRAAAFTWSRSAACVAEVYRSLLAPGALEAPARLSA